ncbi:hypothetical protein AB0305_04130 [Arthrobacter sp. NPDC080086]|uniref:hypothetical protein n=1 Tax=Arthrobacter sp. NPDC080086 TaxID=3155917 RepID=UPI003450FD51
MGLKFCTVFLVIALVPLLSSAEEADKPDFNGAPRRFEQRQDVTMIREHGLEVRSVKNQVLVGNGGGNSLPFWVHLSGENLHLCSISGTAKRKGVRHYVYRGGACLLDIRFKGHTLVLSDVNDSCAPQYCAAPAVFGVRDFVEVTK